MLRWCTLGSFGRYLSPALWGICTNRTWTIFRLLAKHATMPECHYIADYNSYSTKAWPNVICHLVHVLLTHLPVLAWIICEGSIHLHRWTKEDLDRGLAWESQMLKFAAKPPEVPNGEKPLDAPKLAAEVRVLEEENKRLKALVRAQAPASCPLLMCFASWLQFACHASW